MHDKESYLFDCGATSHIISDPSKLVVNDSNFNPESHTIELADNSRQTGVATAKGDAKITLLDSNGNSRDVVLRDVLVIPSYKQNIISVSRITHNGGQVSSSKNKCHIVSKDGIHFPIKQSGRLYYVKNLKNIENPRSNNIVSKTLEEWHYTLGHCNIQDIKNLEKISEDMKIIDKHRSFQCEYCIEAKMTNKIVKTPDKKASKPLEKVHTDLCGPMSEASIQGCKYAVVFVDDHSGLIVHYFIKNKSDAAKATEKYIADMAPYGQVTTIRSDGGGEFISKEYEDLLRRNKINHEFSSPHSPHQNGTAERAWRTTM